MQQAYSIYANFNTQQSSNIAQNTQAQLLASTNCYNTAIQQANNYSNTHNNVAVVYNKEGEAYYLT